MANGLRRHHRISIPGPVRVGWLETGGEQKYVVGRCLDVSESGMRIEVPEPIPRGVYVTIRADAISLVGNASVRSTSRKATRFILGLEFSCPIGNLAKRLLKEDAEAARPPSSGAVRSR